MKKLLLLLLCFPMIGFGQVYNLNAYKYIVIPPSENDPFNIAYTVSEELKTYGIKSFIQLIKVPEDFDFCQSLMCVVDYEPYETVTQIVRLDFFDCDLNHIATSQAGCAACAFTVEGELRKASIKAVKKLKALRNYEYDPEILKPIYPDVELTNETESTLTSYYDSNILHGIEGIYKSTEEGGNTYTVGIKRYGSLFKAIIIKADYDHWKEGEVKIILNQTATKGLYSCSYFLKNKNKVELFLIVENPGLLTFEISDDNNANFIKMYPVNTGVSNGRPSGEWAGNGSGIIISKSGYIITNHHVIDGADDIEVEFILNDEAHKFNAEIVQSDKVNDLAIIKIVDVNFDRVEELPYNFKTRSSDVGTKVYAFGYPMALSIMGKEIKVTDGIISSKTGYEGDITKYQITAPIQGGNSGGPLFDDKGNLIGINAAKLNVKIADNVGYSIKTSYLLNLIDILPKSIELPSNKKLASLPLTEQIKEITKYVVLVKVK
jgi:S1-C subfamily serine protease